MPSSVSGSLHMTSYSKTAQENYMPEPVVAAGNPQSQELLGGMRRGGCVRPPVNLLNDVIGVKISATDLTQCRRKA